MIVAGCDVGSLTAEAVILNDGKILSSEIIRVRQRPEQSAEDAMNGALAKAGLSIEEIEYCVGTGYGREKMPFADKCVTEISCHGRGAQWLVPSVRTVIDLGGQDCKVMRVNEKGKIVKYRVNDKCAAGSGRFLEVMAETLEVGLEEMGALALRSENPANITSQCCVFAESEVISTINEGKEVADIANGLHLSLSRRIASLARTVGLVEEVTVTGGIAKNIAILKGLEDVLKIKIKEMEIADPQIVGALGAALYARDKLKKSGK